MKTPRVKQILAAAATLPVAEARRVVAALAAKEAEMVEEDAAMQTFRTALAEDMRPLGDALYSAFQAGDEAAMQAALKKISKQMPDLAGEASALSAALATALTRELTGS